MPEIFKEKDFIEECYENDIASGYNLFEKALWDAKRVCQVPGRPLDVEESAIELIPDARKYRLQIMEDMIDYYQQHHVNDDDLDTIQLVLRSAQEQEDFDPAVWGAAINILGCHCVEYIEGYQTVVKSLNEVNLAQLHDCTVGRTWGQVGLNCVIVESLENLIEDELAALPLEKFEGDLLKERIQDVLKTLTVRERQVLDFRFGFSDGYGRTLEEVARLFGTTREHIREIEAQALRKLRHPARARWLLEYRLEYYESKCRGSARDIQGQVAEPATKHIGKGLSIDEIVAITHLSKGEINRRIFDGWSYDRIMTERIQPKDSVFTGEMDIGDVRMTIGEWMKSFGLTTDELWPYIPHEGLNANWTRKFTGEAIIKVIKARVASVGLDYAEVEARLGEGWSWKQIVNRSFAEMPENYKSVYLHVNDRKFRIGMWIGDRRMVERSLISALRGKDGKIVWDKNKVVDFVDMTMRRREEQRLEDSKIEWQGLRLTIEEWAERTNLSASAIDARKKSGWIADDIFGIPFPCGRTIKIEGRVYTEKMYREKFGESVDDMLQREESERMERQRQKELREQEEAWRRREELEKRLLQSYDECLERRVKMANVEYTVHEWMDILGIPKDAFKEEIQFLTMYYGGWWCTRMRELLRRKAKLSTNKEIEARVAAKNATQLKSDK